MNEMMKKVSFVKLKERITKRSKNKCKPNDETKKEEECEDSPQRDCGQSLQFDVNYDRLSTHSETNQTNDSNTGLESNRFVKFPSVLLQSFRKNFKKSKSKQKANKISELNQTKPEFGYEFNERKSLNSNQIDLNQELEKQNESTSEGQDLDSSDKQKSIYDSDNEITSTKSKSFKKFSLVEEIERIVGNGWYWGPITRKEAEDRLKDQSDGSFLVRDSSDDHYLFSLSFRSFGRTLHTRIEYTNGLFSFYSNGSTDGNSSLIDLIQNSMTNSEKGVFCYSILGRSPVSPSFPVRLTRPVSRFSEVRSLQYLCKFVIRQSTSFSQIQSLPLPKSIKGFIENKDYF